MRRIRGKARLAQLLLEPTNEIDRKAKDFMDGEHYNLEIVVELWASLRPYAKATTRTMREMDFNGWWVSIPTEDNVE